MQIYSLASSANVKH